MNKKVIAIIIVLCAILVAVFLYFNNKSTGNQKKLNNNTGETNGNTTNVNIVDKKVLVVYFSATNNTKNVAEKIAENLNADTFEIVPEEKYTSADLDWTNDNSRVSKEHADESLRNVKLKTTTVDNWNDYDIVIIGYPIWWGVAAWPVDTFVKANDFSGKTVIPFCTSGGSSISASMSTLKEYKKGINWIEGKRFSSNSKEEIAKWAVWK